MSALSSRNPDRTWADIAESTGLSPAVLRRIRSTFQPYLGLDAQGFPGENTERVVKTIVELKRNGADDEEILNALKSACSAGAGWPEEVLARMEAATSASPPLTATQVLEVLSTQERLPETESSLRESLFDFRREMRLYFIKAREQQDRLEAQLVNLAAEIRELRYALGLVPSRRDRKARPKA